MTTIKRRSGSSANLAEATAAYENPRYRNSVLVLLTFVYVFNFVDRQVINVLAEYIIADLELSDAQFGMLSGLAFAFIYTTLGVPVARLADMGNRRNIVALAVALWSVMTAMCGFAQNFVQLFLARFGVGIGEAGGAPPSHSIVSDIFPPQQRATALSVYSLGVYGGVLIGTVGGAYLVEYFDWRTAFFVVAAPGLLLAPLVRFAIKEPPRGMAERGQDKSPPSFFGVMKFLWQRRSFRHLAFACALHAFVTYGIGNFMPLFFGRVHGMPILEIGWYYGMVAGVGGLSGTFFGGWITDKVSERTGDVRWYMWVPLLSTLFAVPLALLTFLVMPNGYSAAFAYLFAAFFGGWYLAPCIAATHFMVGVRMRALSSAVLLFIVNLIGLGLGPMLTGILSDLLTPSFGVDALRYALSATVLINLWCALHYYWATKNVRGDFALAEG